jgi:hypothetical protein
MVLWWAILGGVVLWIVVDPRPAIAVSLYIMFAVAESVGPFGLQPRISRQMAAYATGAAIVAGPAIWQLYRETAIGRSGKDREDPELADLGGPART